MTAEDTGIFFTDAGAGISVRIISHHTLTATTTLEPLYGTDSDLLENATGELRRKAGDASRGTLRRQGNVFALHAEQPHEKALEKANTTSPEASQPAPGAEPEEETPDSTPSQVDAIEAAKTVTQFVRGKGDVSLEVAKQAQLIVNRFIDEREREMAARDD